MKATKAVNKFRQNIGGIVAGGMTLGVGSMALGEMGTSGAGGQAALGKATPFLGIAGTMSGANAALSMIPRQRRSRKRY